MSTKIKKESTKHRLTELESEEVSVVTRGANRKKFSIIKSEHGVSFQKAMEGDEGAIKDILTVLFEKVSDDTLAEMGLQRVPAPADDGVEKDEDGVEDPKAEENVAKEDPSEDTPVENQSNEEPEENPVEVVSKEDFEALSAKVTEMEEKIAKLSELPTEVSKLKENTRIDQLEERINKISNSTTTQVPEVQKSGESDDDYVGGATLGLHPLNK